MDDILKWLFQSPHALDTIEILLTALVVVVILIYIVAFLQGREISFWPPKIGKRDSQYSWIKKPHKSISKHSSHSAPILSPRHTDITIDSNARSDSEMHKIPVKEITDFIAGEANRHPAMFISPFSSIPLVFREYIVMLSWDGFQISIERLLRRGDAYPTSDSWFSCVSLYRQATMLRYRDRDSKLIITESEARRIIDLYYKLLQHIRGFISLSAENDSQAEYDISVFEPLLKEAEFALFSDNSGIGIVQLEALLSSIHKFLLAHAPQAPLNVHRSLDAASSPLPPVIGSGEKSILIVDDEDFSIDYLRNMLVREGYSVATANNGKDALQAIVERDYDLIITDIFMPVVDGREVVIGAKKINPNTKILVLTAYMGIAREGNSIPFDVILAKPILFRDILVYVRKLLK